MKCPNCGKDANHFIGWQLPDDITQANIILDYRNPNNQASALIQFGKQRYSCKEGVRI
jgi:hypothetical protein